MYLMHKKWHSEQDSGVQRERSYTYVGFDRYLSDFNIIEEVRLCTVIETPKNFFRQT